MCMRWREAPTEFPNAFVARYALDKLHCAHEYLMHTGRVWYDKDLREADALICVAKSNIRKEWIEIAKAVRTIR